MHEAGDFVGWIFVWEGEPRSVHLYAGNTCCTDVCQRQSRRLAKACAGVEVDVLSIVKIRVRAVCRRVDWYNAQCRAPQWRLVKQ